MSATVPPPPGETCLRRGERAVVLEDVFVHWMPISPTLEATQQRRKRGGPPVELPEETVGRMVDVSRHGTAVVAPADDDLVEDATVRVQLGRGFATLRIVHTADLREPGWRLYGTEIVKADETFQKYRDWWLSEDDPADGAGHRWPVDIPGVEASFDWELVPPDEDLAAD